MSEKIPMRIDRRTFLKWIMGLTGASLVGCMARDLFKGVKTPAPTETPTSTLAPTHTPPPGTTSTPVPTPTEEPWILPNRPSKLGIHAIKPNNTFPFVRDVTEGGGHVTLVKALGGIGLLPEVKTVSPNTVTVGRVEDIENVDADGDPAEKAAQIMSVHMEKWAQNREGVDYWEILNEANPGTPEGHAWLARFHSAAMTIAEANGYRLALFSYSTGVPEWQDWAAIVETGVFAQAKAGGHILSLHEYNWPKMSTSWGIGLPNQPTPDPDRGVFTCRYRHLYRDFLIPRNEVIPLAITECGLDPGLPSGETVIDPDWKRRWLKEMAWYDSKLVEDDYVIGAALFTIGGDDRWEHFDFESLLPDLQAYILMLKDAGK